MPSELEAKATLELNRLPPAIRATISDYLAAAISEAKANKPVETNTDGGNDMKLSELTPQQVELLHAAEEAQKQADARDRHFHTAISKPANSLSDDEKKALRSVIDDFAAGRIAL
jgi:hypothetical protein